VTTTAECNRKHWRLWCGIGGAVLVILSAFGSLLCYGFSLGNQAAVNSAKIESMETDVRETRAMVYDIWRKNGGQ